MGVLVLGESDEVRVRREQLASVAMGAALQRLRDGQAPLPLFDGQATAQAERLRREGMSYPQISTVLRLYHDVDLSARGWQHRLRSRGTAPRPRGNGEANFR